MIFPLQDVYHTIYILLKSPQIVHTQKTYTNTYKSCGQKLRPFLQHSLKCFLRQEEHSSIPFNPKYEGKIRYRILHPFFFSHFLDAKATMC